MRDLYKILGAKPEDDFTIIKRKYRELARELHPDRTGGDEAKTARFKQVSVAYAILSNEQRRAQYDRERASAPDTGPGTIFGKDFEDLVDRVSEEGLSAEVIEDFFNYSRKFYSEAPQKIQQVAERHRKTSSKTDQIFSILEDLFGIDTSAPPPSRK